MMEGQWPQMNLSEPFIRRPIATALLMATVAFVGIAAFPFLPIASLPQIDFPTIQVTASLAGASAETMAVSVATPLERQLSQIPGITQLTSLSTVGATQVVIQFDLSRNIDSAAQDVQSAISIAGKTLPLAMTLPPTYRKVNPADPPILILGARSATLPLTRINEYLDSFLAQQIGQMPGVAQAQIGGDRRPSIRIQVDPARLAALGLTLEEIRPTIVSATTAAPKGMLNTVLRSDSRSLPTTRSSRQSFSTTSSSRTGMAVRYGCAMWVRQSPRHRTGTSPVTRITSSVLY